MLTSARVILQYYIGGNVFNAFTVIIRCNRRQLVSCKIQMIKGVRIGGMKTALSYLDTLEVPIIENTPNEEDLKDSMAEAMKQYPDAAAILVRRHGIYVWGMACKYR
jgi:ribulose-5-phosphate 4-epimerase/fuculose-1-phosphate aldolase